MLYENLVSWLPVLGTIALACILIENSWRKREELVTEMVGDLYERVKSGSGIEDALFSSRSRGARLLAGRMRDRLDRGENISLALRNAGRSLGGGFNGVCSVLSCVTEGRGSPSIVLETLRKSLEEKASMVYKRRKETMWLGVGAVMIGVLLVPIVMTLSVSISGTRLSMMDLVFLAWNGGACCAIYCVLSDRWLSMAPLAVLGGIVSILVASVVSGFYGGVEWLVVS